MKKGLKWILAALSAALLLQAGGCGISEANRIYGSRYDLDRALAADIVADLNAGDRAGLKGRLSEICKEFQPDIDERIDELFSSFCGPLELAEYDNGIEEKSVSYGTISRILGFTLELRARENTFYSRVEWYPINQFDQNYEGITFLYFGTQRAEDILPEDVITPDGWQVSLYEFQELGIYTDGNVGQSYQLRPQDELPSFDGRKIFPI